MSVSKNWKAISIAGTAGYEIIVNGEANAGGIITVMPKLEKRTPQGTNPAILQLNLLNASNAQPENFQPVQYNEKTSKENQYTSVDIFHNNEMIKNIKVELK